MVDLRKQVEKLARQDAELKQRKEDQELEKKLAPEKEPNPKEYIKALEQEIANWKLKCEIAISHIPVQDHVKFYPEGIPGSVFQQVMGVQTAMVSVGNKDEQGNSELRYEETEPRKIDLTTHSEIMWAQGVTLNIGNYESARIDVSVKEYCPIDQKEQLLGKLKEFCVGAIKNERLKIEEYRKKRPQ